jgi:hypothetical protein
MIVTGGICSARPFCPLQITCGLVWDRIRASGITWVQWSNNKMKNFSRDFV